MYRLSSAFLVLRYFFCLSALVVYSIFVAFPIFLLVFFMFFASKVGRGKPFFKSTFYFLCTYTIRGKLTIDFVASRIQK